MKLLLTVEVSHEVLAVQSLVQLLPTALDNVAVAVKAGVAATGPDGMLLQAPGADSLVIVRFRLAAEPTSARVESLATTPTDAP